MKENTPNFHYKDEMVNDVQQKSVYSEKKKCEKI
jgi:hypothetical protein